MTKFLITLRWSLLFVLLGALWGCSTEPGGGIPPEDVPALEVSGDATDDAQGDAPTGSDALAEGGAPDGQIPSPDVMPDALPDVTLDASGAGFTCDGAERVTAGAMLRGVSTGGASVTTLACLAEYRGAMRFYRVEVPAGQLVDVLATPTGGADAGAAPIAVRVFENCDGTCLHASPGVGRWLNTSLAPRAVIVAVGGMTTEPVTFDVSFMVRAVSAGDTCAAPIDLPGAMRLRVDTVPASASAPLCDGTTARARWFRINIPAGNELAVRATDAPSVSLRVATTCAATTCLTGAVGSVVLARAAVDRVVLVSATPPNDSPFTLDFALNPTAMPGVCASSAIYRTSTTLTGESITNARDPATDCQGSTRPAVFYRVVVPAGQRLTATFTNYDLFARIFEPCGASTCLATTGLSSSTQTARYVNSTTAERTLVVAVSLRFSSPISTTYNLTLTLDTPPPSTSCMTAPLVMSGATVTGNIAEASEAATLCAGSGTGRALFYAVEVPAGRRLLVSGQMYTNARIIQTCGDTACLGSRWSTDSSVFYGTSTAWTNTSAMMARVIVALSYYSEFSSGTVGAGFLVGTPLPEGSCASAPTLTTDTTLPDLSSQSSDQSFAACTPSSAPLPALWWRVTVPAGRRVIVTQRVSASSSFYGTTGLAFVSACGAVSCLGVASGTTSSSSTLPRVLSWSNTGSTATMVYLVAFGGPVPFQLSVSFEAPVAHTTCATAMALTPGRPAAGQRFVDAGEPATVCGSSVGTLPALYYRVSVPAGQRLDVSVTSAGASHITRLFTSCGAVTCLATGSNSSGSASVTRWANTATTAREVVVAVSRGTVTDGLSGAFDVTPTLVTPPANSRCTSPATLTSGAAVSGLTENAGDAITDCASTTYPALFYQISVPAGQRVVARLAVGSSFDGAFVRIVQTCASVSCLGTISTYDGVAWWTNSGTTAQTVIVAVGARVAGVSYPFTLTATVEAPAANGRCASAMRVTSPASLANQRFVDGTDTPLCLTGTRPSLFYQVSVPVGRRLSVRATVLGGASSAIVSVLSGCAGMCLIVADSYRGAVLWANSAASARDVIVAVTPSSTSSLITSVVSLDFSVQAIPEAGLCATATTLTNGLSQVVNWADASESVTTCGASAASLPSLFYAVDVPAGQALTAQLSGSYAYYAGLRILSNCTAPTCLVPWRTTTSSSTPITATYRNSSGSIQRVYIAASVTDSFAATTTAVVTALVTP
jgi:hypothetical protein